MTTPSTDTHSSMVACPPLEDIAAFLDGTLSPEERARITEHLARCESCYEIFAGAVHFQEDIGRGDVHPLPLTDLNDYLDGALSPEERAHITEHLARCESCYEVFAGAVRFQEETSAAEDTGGRGVIPFPLVEEKAQEKHARVEPARSPRRASRWLPLAASVVLAVGLGWALFFVPPEITLAGVIEPVEKGIESSDVLYDNTKRGTPVGHAPLFSPGPSVMVGVHALDLRLSVETNDVDATASRLQAIGIELEDDVTAHPELSRRYSAAYERVHPQDDLDSFRPELPELERELQESFQDSVLFQFGLWAEAGRLAAKTGSPDFFKHRTNRRFLAHAQKVLPRELGEELWSFIQDDLKAIERTWDQRELSKDDYSTLEGRFERIIRQIDDYEEG